MPSSPAVQKTTEPRTGTTDKDHAYIFHNKSAVRAAPPKTRLPRLNVTCSEWSANEQTLQSPLSTVCGQYCVVFLMLRCRNVPMHAFSRLFTTDLIANDCRVFDWLGVHNRK